MADRPPSPTISKLKLTQSLDEKPAQSTPRAPPRATPRGSTARRASSARQKPKEEQAEVPWWESAPKPSPVSRTPRKRAPIPQGHVGHSPLHGQTARATMEDDRSSEKSASFTEPSSKAEGTRSLTSRRDSSNRTDLSAPRETYVEKVARMKAEAAAKRTQAAAQVHRAPPQQNSVPTPRMSLDLGSLDIRGKEEGKKKAASEKDEEDPWAGMSLSDVMVPTPRRNSRSKPPRRLSGGSGAANSIPASLDEVNEGNEQQRVPRACSMEQAQGGGNDSPSFDRRESEGNLSGRPTEYSGLTPKLNLAAPVNLDDMPVGTPRQQQDWSEYPDPSPTNFDDMPIGSGRKSKQPSEYPEPVNHDEMPIGSSRKSKQPSEYPEPVNHDEMPIGSSRKSKQQSEYPEPQASVNEASSATVSTERPAYKPLRKGGALETHDDMPIGSSRRGKQPSEYPEPVNHDEMPIGSGRKSKQPSEYPEPMDTQPAPQSARGRKKAPLPKRPGSDSQQLPEAPQAKEMSKKASKTRYTSPCARNMNRSGGDVDQGVIEEMENMLKTKVRDHVHSKRAGSEDPITSPSKPSPGKPSGRGGGPASPRRTPQTSPRTSPRPSPAPSPQSSPRLDPSSPPSTSPPASARLVSNSVEKPPAKAQWTFDTLEFTHQGGSGPPHVKENQDAFFTVELSEGNAIYAVFDGHGKEFGREAGIVAADVCKAYLVEHFEDIKTAPKETMKEAFRLADEAIYAAILQSKEVFESHGALVADCPTSEWPSGFDAVDGGTTATVVALIDGARLVVSAVGDSSALAGCVRETSRGARVAFQNLSAEHSPTNMDEYERITKYMKDKQEGCKFIFECPRQWEPDCYFPVYNTDARGNPTFANPPPDGYVKTVRGEFSSVVMTPEDPLFSQRVSAMTRSLGDFYLRKYGTTWEPETQLFDLSDICRGAAKSILMVASDGFWDLWKYKEFVEYLMQTDDGRIDCPAETRWLRFCENTRTMGHGLFGERADNLTAVLINIRKI